MVPFPGAVSHIGVYYSTPKPSTFSLNAQKAKLFKVWVKRAWNL
jgi:hypothetical protein